MGGGDPSRQFCLGGSFCSSDRGSPWAWTPPLLVQRKEVTVLAGSILRKPGEPEFESQPCPFSCCVTLGKSLSFLAFSSPT